MKSKVSYLNNLSAVRKAEISVENEKRLSFGDGNPKSGSEAILARIPNHYKSEWHMFAPVEYLAMLDREGVSACIRTYSVNDNARAWANE